MSEQAATKGSVFIVEDEAMIRMLVVDMLEELGYTIAAESGDLDEALERQADTAFDVAVLDVNVNGKIVMPLAEVLRARGLPFVFSTGYGANGIPDEFRDAPVLQKPFQMEALLAALERALGRG